MRPRAFHALGILSFSVLFSFAFFDETLLAQDRQPNPARAKIKIGVSTALTGNAATYGVDLKNSLLFANEKLGHNKYELILEDDKCNGKDAVSVAHRFLDILKIRYALGFACSSTVFSTAQLYEKAKVPVMVTCASAPDISKAGDFIFRTWPSDIGAAKKLFQYVSPRHKIFGIMSEQTDYSQGILQAFENENSSGVIKITNENYLTDTPDVRSLLLRLKSKSIDGLFINSQSEQTFLNVLKQTKEMGIKVPIYSAYMAVSSAFLDKAKGLGDGILAVDLPPLSQVVSEEGQALFSEFLTRYGKINSIDMLFATSFEGFRALHQAIESGKDLREYLYTTRFNGIFGEWGFDRNGEIQGLDFVMKVIKDGKAVLIS